MNTMMTFNYFTFDTLEFVKKLENVGVKPEIAEVQAQLQIELHKTIITQQEAANQQLYNKFMEYQPLLEELKDSKDEFATKKDILMLENKIDGLRHELFGEIGELHSELQGKMGELRSELRGEMGELRGDMKNLKNELLVKLGGVVVACSTILAAVIVVIR